MLYNKIVFEEKGLFMLKRSLLGLVASLCLLGLHATEEKAPASTSRHYKGKPQSSQVDALVKDITSGVGNRVLGLFDSEKQWNWLKIGYAPDRLSSVLGILLLLDFEYQNKEGYAEALRKKMADFGFVMDDAELEKAKTDHTTARLREGWYTKPALEHWDRREDIRGNPGRALVQALLDVARCEKGDGNEVGNPEALAKRRNLEAAEEILQDEEKILQRLLNDFNPKPTVTSKKQEGCNVKLWVTCMVVPVLAFLYTRWHQA